MLDQDASELSAGQKQLLTIARAILANDNVLIFDEATSDVDTRHEIWIQDATTRRRDGRTSFVISHRLSTIRDAHVLIVMNKGRIVTRGGRGSLMASRGLHFDLYNSQFAGVAI